MNSKIRTVLSNLSSKSKHSFNKRNAPKYYEHQIQVIKHYNRLRSMQYKRSVQNRRIVEDLYFTDYSQDIQSQILNQHQHSDIQQHNIDQALQIDSQTKYRNMVQPQYSHHNESSSYYIRIIKQNSNNNLLLDYFKEIHQNIDQQVLYEIFRKVIHNYENQEEIKMKELRKYEEKKSKLKSINKKINVEFSLKFLNRDQLMNHQGYQLMVSKMIGYLKEGCDEGYQNYSLLLTILVFSRFDGQSSLQMQQMIDSLFDRVSNDILELENGQIKIVLEIALQLYSNKLLNRNQINMVKNIVQEMGQRDLVELEYMEISKLVKTQRVIRQSMDKQLLYRLEPYILKYLREYDIEQKIDIIINYLMVGVGTNQFIHLLYNNIIQNANSITQLQSMKLIKKVNKTEITRFVELQLHHLIRVVIEQLVKNLHQQQVQLEDVMFIQNQLEDCQIYNKNYYELLSVIVVKLNQKQSLENNYLGYQCMQWLSHNNITSSVLLNITKKQLDYQTKQQTMLQIDNQNRTGQQDQKREHQKQLINSFQFQVKQLWSYTYQIMMQKEQKNTDFDIYNQYCSKIQQILQQIDCKIQISRVMVEKIDQINFFIRNESFRMIIRSINCSNIEIVEEEQEVINQNKDYELLCQLEKQYFLQKYGDYLQKYMKVNDYVIDYSLVIDNKQLYLFISGNGYSQYDYGWNRVIKNGVYQLRTLFMNKVLENIVYIDIESNQMIQESVYKLNQTRIGCIEYMVQQQDIGIGLKQDNQYQDVLDQIVQLRQEIFDKGGLALTTQDHQTIYPLDQKDQLDDHDQHDDDDLFDQYIDSSDAEY